ncbi:MAG: hypothetical protein NUW01_14360 [Gemmatimonadaceae bacterium]|nr:hypothetical protein [Gemmatimonadaceae bacterium]
MSTIDDFQQAMRARLKDPETWKELSEDEAWQRIEDHYATLERIGFDDPRNPALLVDLANWALILWTQLQKEGE